MPSIGFDLQNNFTEGVSIKIATRTTGTVNGSGVDLGNTDGPVTATYFAGTISGLGTVLDISLQESKNDNTADVTGVADAYAAMSPAAAFATFTAASDKVKRLTTMSRSKRWVRAVSVPSGSTATNSVYGVLVGAKTRSYPRTN